MGNQNPEKTQSCHMLPSLKSDQFENKLMICVYSKKKDHVIDPWRKNKKKHGH